MVDDYLLPETWLYYENYNMGRFPVLQTFNKINGLNKRNKKLFTASEDAKRNP